MASAWSVYRVNEGSSRLSIPPVNVAPSVPPALIHIQDEIRTDFGWRLEQDSISARELRDACDDKSWSVPSWTEKGRATTRLNLQERLISTPLTILGAAADADDAADSDDADDAGDDDDVDVDNDNVDGDDDDVLQSSCWI